MSGFLRRFRDALSSGEAATSRREAATVRFGFTGGVELTERTARVGEAFGLELDGRRHLLYHDFELRLEEGDVAYITGDSGSGKSVPLRALREDHVVAMRLLPEPADVALVDARGGNSFREAM